MTTFERARRIEASTIGDEARRIVAELDAEAGCTEEAARSMAEFGCGRIELMLDCGSCSTDVEQLVYGDYPPYGGDQATMTAALVLAARGDVRGTLALRNLWDLPAFC